MKTRIATITARGQTRNLVNTDLRRALFAAHPTEDVGEETGGIADLEAFVLHGVGIAHYDEAAFAHARAGDHGLHHAPAGSAIDNGKRLFAENNQRAALIGRSDFPDAVLKVSDIGWILRDGNAEQGQRQEHQGNSRSNMAHA